jgi:conjugative transfer signal peptidase TraF
LTASRRWLPAPPPPSPHGAAAIDYPDHGAVQDRPPLAACSRQPRRHRPTPPPRRRTRLAGAARTRTALLTALLAVPLATLLPAPTNPHPKPWRPPAIPLRLNLTASLPPGLYRLSPLRRPPCPGDLVLACPPPAAAALAHRRGYLGPGSCPGDTHPLGKLVLAAAGDRVELTAAAIIVNGCRLPATPSAPADARGRPLPHPPPGAYLLRAGDLWLFAPHPRSFDSRYFGPVAASKVRGLLHPLLVLPSPGLRRWTALLRACAARR